MDVIVTKTTHRSGNDTKHHRMSVTQIVLLFHRGAVTLEKAIYFQNMTKRGYCAECVGTGERICMI